MCKLFLACEVFIYQSTVKPHLCPPSDGRDIVDTALCPSMFAHHWTVSFTFLTSYRRSLPLLRPNKMLCVYYIMFAPQYYSKGFPTSPFHSLTINASVHMGLLVYTAYSALLFLCSTIILPPTLDGFRPVHLQLQHVLRKLFLTCAVFIYQSTAEPPLCPPSDCS